MVADLPAGLKPYEEPEERHNLGRMEYNCQHCNALHWLDEKLAHSSQSNPKFSSCCNRGKVALPLLQDPPAALRHLFEGNEADAIHFRDHIWEYNRALAFTSMGVTEDHSVNQGRGPPVFRISGELHHLSGSLLPAPGRNPIYAQLYFVFGGESSVEWRYKNNAGELRKDVLKILENVIKQYNPYAPIYLHAFQVLSTHDPQADVAVRLRLEPGHDPRRYNLPSASEVAVVLPGEFTQSNSRDILLHLHGGVLHRISHLHPSYTPLYYVILFPYGEPGWYPELKIMTSTKRLTLMRYASFRLHDRHGEFSCLLHGGRLFQRYLVDMWATDEQNKLFYLLKHQDEIRAAHYNGLQDALNGENNSNLNNIGRRIILPSSHLGSPRHMQEQFQDSMAIARHHRKVDLFITMTTNSNWLEIFQELRPGETAYNRPDLVARVFYMKMKALIKEIRSGLFGPIAAIVWNVEFQKRSLPHVHILIFLKPPFKLYTPHAIDTIIQACWPDQHQHPMLWGTIKSCMVHGPCGALNPKAPCMEDNKCTKGYPKQFRDNTSMDEDGFPQYRRPANGPIYCVGNYEVDNSWIVPYNPYLSTKYNCHINVECAASLVSFKYIFKYISKGCDRATMQLYRDDEITRHVLGRYISASEAAWRLFQFDTHDRFPTVTRLQIHLENDHVVAFRPNESAEVVLQRAAGKRTTLTAFFEANTDSGPFGEEARKYTYQEFPQFFTWKQEQQQWALRQQGFSLGRIYFVSPTVGEQFYLRLLLTIVKGPRSFNDLKCYNDECFGTFQEACIARGLLENDGEWDQCVREASDMQTGLQLRYLFATLLRHCITRNPTTLWNRYRHKICDDLCYRLHQTGRQQVSDEEVYDYGLFLLDTELKHMGSCLAQHIMPPIQHDWDVQVLNPYFAEQHNYDTNLERQQAQNRLATFTDDQRAVYDDIIRSVKYNMGQIFFVSGPGGCGKTYLYNTICNKIRGDGGIVLVVASSGIAALLIAGGRTAHSTFKLPINLTSTSICDINKDGPYADLIRQTHLIIWDESLMQHRHGPEAVDRSCRDICDNDMPFGGITTVFGADPQQILPVIPRGRREDIINAVLMNSPLWPSIRVHHLRGNMRLEQNPSAASYQAWLLDIGHGRTRDADGTVAIPHEMIIRSPQQLIDFIYPNIDHNSPPSPDYFSQRMILAPRNTDVDDINLEVLNRMGGQEKVFYSADHITSETDTDNADKEQPIAPEVLRALEISGLPPGELHLKIGCSLILLRNLSVKRGLCNGTRMVLVNMNNYILQVRITTGDHQGELAFIPRISLTPSGHNGDHLPFKFARRQFPVRLAFALSINKSQGQDAKYIGLDLRIPVFAHGQLYVALSRATAMSGVRVLLEGSIDRTPNVVYDEVLLE